MADKTFRLEFRYRDSEGILQTYTKDIHSTSLKDAKVTGKNLEKQTGHWFMGADAVHNPGNPHPKPTSEAKEPWKMTTGEYLDAEHAQMKGQSGYQKYTNTRKRHRTIVEKALKEGKPVPAEVLKDYPELGKRGTESTPKEQAMSAIKTGQLPDRAFSGDVMKALRNANIIRRHSTGFGYTIDKMAGFKEVMENKGILPAAKPEPKAESKGKGRTRKPSMVEQVMNKVHVYGGFPLRYGDMQRHLEEVAKSRGEKDPQKTMGMVNASLLGHMNWESRNPKFKSENLPKDVEPLTYQEFEKVSELKGDEKMPESIRRKMLTIYPKEERHRFEAKAKEKKGWRPITIEGVECLAKRDLDAPTSSKWKIVEAKTGASVLPPSWEGGLSAGTLEGAKYIAQRELAKMGKEKIEARIKELQKPKKEIATLKPKPVTKQSDRAIAIDRALLAKQVVSVDDPRWLARPNRFDVRGIDTPGSGRVVSRTGFADKGKTRMSRKHHRGWKRIKL